MYASPWLKDEVVDRLKVLWVDHSAGQIAGVLWDEFRLQVTRNAVVGKLFRMGLTINDKSELHPLTSNEPNKRSRGPRVLREHKPVIRISRANGNSNQLRAFQSATTEMAPLRCVAIEPLHIGLSDLTEATCRYPFGDDPGSMTYCGHPTSVGSYCRGHFALTHYRPQVLTEAEHERRRRRFMGLNRQSAKAMGVPA